MAKKKIEIQEPEVEVTEVPEEEKKSILRNTGFWCALSTGAAVSAAALYFIWKSMKEEAEPSVDLFKAPVQPTVPHLDPEPFDVKITEEVEVEPSVAEIPAEEVAAAPVEELPDLPPFDENATFIGNYDTKVFHTRDCGLGERILEGHKVSLYSVEEAFAAEYKPCGRCKPNGTGDIVCNTESMVFHKPDCTSAARMLDDKKYFMKDRESAITAGYKPCGRCKP